MNRPVTTFLLCLAATMTVAAEEISLKDGTKIVGHMTAMSPDKIEVETSYGKVQLKRADILTINFPENGAPPLNSTATKPADPNAVNVDPPKIDESLTGEQYVNRTGKFSLTVPADWILSPSLRHTPGSLAALSSKDQTRFLMVVREEYPGALDSYKEVTYIQARKSLSNFEQLSESPTTIDGRPGMLIFYRGTLAKANNLPVEFVSALIPQGKNYTKLSAWCIEPLFREMQPAFERILNSYRSTAAQTSAVVSQP